MYNVPNQSKGDGIRLKGDGIRQGRKSGPSPDRTIFSTPQPTQKLAYVYFRVILSLPVEGYQDSKPHISATPQ